MAPARLAAVAVAMRVEQVDATRRRAPQAGEAAVGQAQAAQEQAAQEQAVQVTLEVTWRHCMATTQPAERPALQRAGPAQEAPTAEALVALEPELAPTG